MERDDTYVAQLYQVFKSCDLYGTGLLGEDELFNLCMRLQLDDRQTNYIITNLIGNDILAKVSDNTVRVIYSKRLMTVWIDETSHAQTCGHPMSLALDGQPLT